MKSFSLSVVALLISLSFAGSVCRGADAHVAAVGQDEAGRYLKIARVEDVAGSPGVEQIEIDISTDFNSVSDVAFLAATGCCGRMIAVLGNCSVYVPYETGWWWGNDHHLEGKIVVYQVAPSGPLTVARAANLTYSEWFETSWDTVDDGTIPGQPGQSYQIGGLASGGFVVECNAMKRLCGSGGCTDDAFANYNKLLFFDSSYELRFMADGPTPVLASRDICGLVESDPDRFIWVYRGYAGSPGKVYRYAVDWENSQIIHEATMHGGISTGCYYPAQVAPLADVPGHVVAGGTVVRNDFEAAYNASKDFPNDAYFTNSQGWGYYWPGNVDEVIGISSEGDDLHVVLRQDVNDYGFYRLVDANGTYEDCGFEFQWGGTDWTIAASDGDAMSNITTEEEAFTSCTLTATTTSETILSEDIMASTGTMDAANVAGDFTGTVSFDPFELIGIRSGTFEGKGFAKGDWNATLESAPYKGSWHGMFYHVPEEDRVVLKGSISGQIKGTVLGYLTESVPDSDVFDTYEATWNLIQVSDQLVSASVDVNGLIVYEDSNGYASTELALLQGSFSGASSGYKTGSHNAVLSHVGITDTNNPYFGEGFSLISYSSTEGSGTAWAYGRASSDENLQLSGTYDEPLVGCFSGVLDMGESGASLSFSVQRTDFGLPPMADLEVTTWGPERVSPGETIDYVIEYRNQGVEFAEDVVVINRLPGEVTYESSTEDGMYFSESHEVVWRLGSIPPGGSGLLIARVTVVWGLAGHSTFRNHVFIDTPGDELSSYLDPELNIYNIDEYLTKEPLQTVEVRPISTTELDSELGDAQFADMFSYAIESGFEYAFVAIKSTLNDGTTIVDAVMTQEANEPNEGVFVRKVVIPADKGGTYSYSVLMKANTDSREISVFDRGGGMSHTLGSETLDMWGSWGAKHSCTFGQQLFNCLWDNLGLSDPGMAIISNAGLAGEGQFEVLTYILGTVSCGQCIGSGGVNLTACDQCAAAIADVIDPSGMSPYAVFALACLVHVSWVPEDYSCEFCTHREICRITSREVASEHCTEDCRWQPAELYPEGSPHYRPVVSCGFGEICRQLSGASAGCKPTVNSSTHESEVITGGDPNIKRGPAGRVCPGQRLDYNVEYENVGEGIAFGVYFTDTLDEDVNDLSLEIGPVKDVNDDSVIGEPGTYDPNTRTITWFAGRVDPNQGGYAEFSVKAADNAPHGTEIINFATVYFPSVPEETRTNAVISIVAPADIHYDGIVNFLDYTVLAGSWLETDPTANIAPDCGEGIVDLEDLILFANDWLEESTF